MPLFRTPVCLTGMGPRCADLHNSFSGPTLPLFFRTRGRLVLEEGPQLLERQHLVGPHHFDRWYDSVGGRRIIWS